jgi:hypothetical protein
MFSFWPSFFARVRPAYEEMERSATISSNAPGHGFHPSGQALYVEFNPQREKILQAVCIDRGLFFNWVAEPWWLATDEPETEGGKNNIIYRRPTSCSGSGAPLRESVSDGMNHHCVYDGQRRPSDQKRVFHGFRDRAFAVSSPAQCINCVGRAMSNPTG